ncbi:MAG: gabD2 [Nocardia sp.]|uniref:succinic semialdehyde dehydrogenase n=1 Tax=Nocardia sp. TaxID=1821 RepID=UPI00261BA2ED|nr:succinic semialdehyde dehydrogenase [Nocardia sp.]MCU1641350.1 gabD2 [Nocardia sp.]
MTDSILPPSIDLPLIGRLRDQLPKSTETHCARAPFTDTELPEVPQSDNAAIEQAAAAGRAAQPEWARLPIKQRERIILRFARLLLDHHDQLCDLMQWETGKARVHATIEAQGVVSVALHYGRNGAGYLAERKAPGMGPIRARVGYRPKGLVGVIAPWNYPLFLAVGDVIPALIAGNAVLSKADSQAPWTLLLARHLAVRAGVPEQIWQVVAGPGSRIGPAVIDAVDYLCFTGSTETGRDIARRCAERLIGASLELGGKNAMIVRADADLAAAATGAVQACFSSAGQMCIGIERIYVHESVFPRFVDALVARTRKLRLGGGYSLAIDMGSLTSHRQLVTTVRHVADAVEQGATVLAGGNTRPDLGPLFFEPTILTDVTPDMLVYAEETFGPVVTVVAVASDEEAIARANEGRYGLSASVWTRDLPRGRTIAAQIVAGAVNINDGYLSAIAALHAPMGGMRDSGLGRRHGREGIVRYTEPQTITTQRISTPYPDRFREPALAAMRQVMRVTVRLSQRM